MEEVVLLSCQKQHIPARKFSFGGFSKDLWAAVRDGSVADVDSSLAFLKKNGGNINFRNAFGLTPLHIATWRNHIPIVKRLLAAGADPNVRDWESGWSSLHRALHFGHLAVASILLQSRASIILEDTKSRTPIDLLSGTDLLGIEKNNSAATEVFSWGSGVNYQLGTGNAHLQKLPCKVDSLHGSVIKLVSAAKFHSAAVTACGELYTWGFGRGGRLGHPDFDIHSGQAAVITPRKVISGLGARRVKAVAAAKHHTVIATEAGEVFTWGSNREGQLGYASVDTQPTPRRVSSLRSKVVALAAANKHTAVVSDLGEVFTWGCNKEGQLGYGTSNSASNYAPRVVEYLKGKAFVGVAAAKYHTIVLGSDGEVFTWGHLLVTPKRVVIGRILKKIGTIQLKFHRKESLHVVAIAAGATHSMALTEDGTLLYWVSSDPDLHCQQFYSLCGTNVVCISAGKYWIAAVTVAGDVYVWDGKKGKEKPLILTRLHGVKKATSVSVGETHLLIITSLYHPVYPPNMSKDHSMPKQKMKSDPDELNEGFVFDEVESEEVLFISEKDNVKNHNAPTLKSLCEMATAEHLLEPRNAMQLLEISDSIGAEDLRKHCEDIAIRNLDYIFTVSGHAVANTSLDVLVMLEKAWDMKSSEPWSYRRLPTPTAPFPAIVDSEEDNDDIESLRTRDNCTSRPMLRQARDQIFDNFPQSDEMKEGVLKQVRSFRKKLQQIEMLEVKRFKGQTLDDQQIAKLQTRSALEKSLAELGVPVGTLQSTVSSSVLADGKGSNKVHVPKKQRRKSKQKAAPVEVVSAQSESAEPSPRKGALIVPEVQYEDDYKGLEGAAGNLDAKDSPFVIQRHLGSTCNSNRSSAVASKKKNRKGGLSMFLSGALDDDVSKVVIPPPFVQTSEGPAWGGAKVAKCSASLREIQDEQSKVIDMKPLKLRDPVEDPSGDSSGGKLRLSAFIQSSPIPMSQAASVSDVEKNTPPWAASGTPPCLHPSLRDIQLQQGKQPLALSHSPKTRTTGFSVMTGQGSASESSCPSRWFRPETETPLSMRSIQIEERAIKDLKRFYSNVRVVKNPKNANNFLA
ncbi:hypothetical protein FXO38_35500 [Capsicum annuum]|uniref:uncharacterized protein LOC107858503 n=1 Tax=Capsicum annuum TaxID=4072 RepID=UPI001FB04E26|nr:uncharacterized protein LOC107858503 [Capsicum annuum]XP_047253268.1 uncharacterized protein LOC107858503 [Capsicum annuum]KAF3614707.1 hypothetical protein FXO38_35500 [Capsicum annuum]